LREQLYAADAATTLHLHPTISSVTQPNFFGANLKTLVIADIGAVVASAIIPAKNAMELAQA